MTRILLVLIASALAAGCGQGYHEQREARWANAVTRACADRGGVAHATGQRIVVCKDGTAVAVRR